MSVVTKTITQEFWHCDIACCGYEWPRKESVAKPTQCPNKDCRSRNWDQKVETLPESEKIPQIGKNPEPIRPDQISQIEKQGRPDAPDRERKPLCKKSEHIGLWRKDGYWCVNCGKLYRED